MEEMHREVYREGASLSQHVLANLEVLSTLY